MALCNVWSCGCCVFIVGCVEGFRWSVDTSVRIGVLEAQDAVLWAWSGSSLPAECTVIINTLGHTPWIWALKWAWSGCLHLT